MRWTVAWALIWWLLLCGFWFVLVDTFEWPEVLVGVVAAAISAGAALAIRAEGRISFPVRWQWLPLLASLPLGALHDTAIVFLALGRALRRRPVRGVFRIVTFPAGGGDPESTIWRAFCTTATSVTPNTFVVDIDRERGEMLIHQLVPTPPEALKRKVVGAS